MVDGRLEATINQTILIMEQHKFVRKLCEERRNRLLRNMVHERRLKHDGIEGWRLAEHWRLQRNSGHLHGYLAVVRLIPVGIEEVDEGRKSLF